MNAAPSETAFQRRIKLLYLEIGNAVQYCIVTFRARYFLLDHTEAVLQWTRGQE